MERTDTLHDVVRNIVAGELEFAQRGVRLADEQKFTTADQSNIVPSQI